MEINNDQRLINCKISIYCYYLNTFLRDTRQKIILDSVKCIDFTLMFLFYICRLSSSFGAVKMLKLSNFGLVFGR